MHKDLYKDIAEGLAGELVRRHEKLGDSFFKSKEVVALMYPDGIPVEQYEDALVVSRIIDKLFGIAHVPGDKQYWSDILGLVMLRLASDAYHTTPTDNTDKEFGNHEQSN